MEQYKKNLFALVVVPLFLGVLYYGDVSFLGASAGVNDDVNTTIANLEKVRAAIGYDNGSTRVAGLLDDMIAVSDNDLDRVSAVAKVSKAEERVSIALENLRSNRFTDAYASILNARSRIRTAIVLLDQAEHRTDYANFITRLNNILGGTTDIPGLTTVLSSLTPLLASGNTGGTVTGTGTSSGGGTVTGTGTTNTRPTGTPTQPGRVTGNIGGGTTVPPRTNILVNGRLPASQAECDDASRAVCENIKNGRTDEKRAQARYCFNVGGDAGTKINEEYKDAKCNLLTGPGGGSSPLRDCMSAGVTNCRNNTKDSQGNTCTTGPAGRSCPIGADGGLPQAVSDCEDAARNACYGTVVSGGKDTCIAIENRGNENAVSYQSGKGVCPAGKQIDANVFGLSNKSILIRACGGRRDGSFQYQPSACATDSSLERGLGVIAGQATDADGKSTNCASLCTKIP